MGITQTFDSEKKQKRLQRQIIAMRDGEEVSMSELRFLNFLRNFYLQLHFMLILELQIQALYEIRECLGSNIHLKFFKLHLLPALIYLVFKKNYVCLLEPFSAFWESHENQVEY